jgi:hypothetical protein
MFWTRIGSGLALSVAICFGVTGAQAQTANNLKCKGCVGTRDLGANAVKTKKIKDGAITTSKIKDGAVTVEKLNQNAKTSVSASRTNTNSFTSLTNTPATVKSVNFDVSGPGAVTLIYSVVLYKNAVSSQAYCYINPLPSFRCVVSGVADTGYGLCSGVETIPVSAAGNQTFDLMCVEQVGDVQYLDTSLSALYTLNAGTINNADAKNAGSAQYGASEPPPTH